MANLTKEEFQRKQIMQIEFQEKDWIKLFIQF